MSIEESPEREGSRPLEFLAKTAKVIGGAALGAAGGYLAGRGIENLIGQTDPQIVLETATAAGGALLVGLITAEVS